jgi:hypothetical protein
VEPDLPQFWWNVLDLPGTSEVGKNGNLNLGGIFLCPFQRPVKVQTLTMTRTSAPRFALAFSFDLHPPFRPSESYHGPDRGRPRPQLVRKCKLAATSDLPVLRGAGTAQPRR